MVRTYERYDPNWNPLNHHLTWHLPLQKTLDTTARMRELGVSFCTVHHSDSFIIYLTCVDISYKYWRYWRCHNVLVQLELSRGMAFSAYRKWNSLIGQLSTLWCCTVHLFT